MSLQFRHLLIWLVAAAWIWGTCRFELGNPTLAELFSWDFRDMVRARYSEFDLGLWFVSMMAAIVVSDRLLCRFADWRWGVDPMKVHWSTLRVRDGRFLCPACLGSFMLPPEDLDPKRFVTCGDCGHAIAAYGEMKPYFATMLVRPGETSRPAP